MKIHKKKIMEKFLENFEKVGDSEKILTKFIFFIGKLQRNLENIFDEVITNL